MNFSARPAHLRSVSITLAAALGMCLLAGSFQPAVAKELSAQDLQRLASIATDSTQSRSVATQIKEYLASATDSTYVPYARMILVQSLMTSRAPVREFTAEVARAAAVLPDRPEAKASFYASVAAHLADRGEALTEAQNYVNQAIKSCPKEPQYRGLMSLSRSTLGMIQIKLGQPAAAIATLNLAMADTPDSQTVLYRLGLAQEKSGKPDVAIATYVRSLAVFPGRDSSAAAPLRALYVKRGGKLAELDARIATARAASVKAVALDSHRHEGPAPDWSLPDLDGNIVHFASFKGKVVVLDFWGSWCGPCRMELPFFQSLYENYRDNKDVVVLGMNWERAETAPEHLRAAREYMKQNSFTFPVVYDHAQVAVKGFGIQGFPSVFLIDKTGQIRYRNVGFDPSIDDIMEAQIQSLLR